MDNFQIETAQNINIRHNIAGIGERILAFFIDLLIIIVYIILSGLILAGVTQGNDTVWMYYLVLGLPTFLYYLVWETLWNGQTPGKAILDLRVVRKDGTRPAFSNYLIRWLLRFIDISISSGGVAVVTILFTGKGQRLGDIAAGTTVISEKKNFGIEHTLGADFPPNYIPQYPQVTILTDRDVQQIKNIYKTAKANDQHHIILNLSEKVAKLLDVKFTESPVEFINNVVTDYNYYTSQ